MFPTKRLEKIKTHFMFNNFFVVVNLAVGEIMWKDIVELSKPQITIRRMRIVFWIAKAKNTFSEYVIIIVFPTATIFALKLLNVALFVHYLSCQALINSFLNAIPKSGIKSLYKHSASILH